MEVWLQVVSELCIKKLDWEKKIPKFEWETNARAFEGKDNWKTNINS